MERQIGPSHARDIQWRGRVFDWSCLGRFVVVIAGRGAAVAGRDERVDSRSGRAHEHVFEQVYGCVSPFNLAVAEARGQYLNRNPSGIPGVQRRGEKDDPVGKRLEVCLKDV